MSLSVLKLRLLWKHHNTPLSGAIAARCQQIETVIENWNNSQASLPTFSPAVTAESAGYPTNNWNQVKAKFRKYYQDNDALRNVISQIDEVSDLLHIQSRDGRFRVSSNAIGSSEYESDTTTPTQSNPESFLASYNFPFQVIRFFHECKSGSTGKSLSWFRPQRFNVKFLWMLANREKHLPILSLQSFRELKCLFQTEEKDLESLTLEEFASAWPEVSETLCFEITGGSYAQLPFDQKSRLWRLLFLASVQTTSTKNAFDMLQTGNRALILYGPPGTGKTFHAKKIAEQMLFPRGATEEALKAQQFSTSISSIVSTQSAAHGCWELVQFHPSYSYQDFIGGILPRLDGEKLSYSLNKGIFLRFCEEAMSRPELPFILIIDEINRADLSSVLGELMYALEYRSEPVQITHFGSFRIPLNVYLIGTMNTADKSLVSFDLALRRRFTFLKLNPDLECLGDWGKALGFSEFEMAQIIERAKSLNMWLTDSRDGLGRSAEFAIGQAYFMKLLDFYPANQDRRTLTSFALEQLWDYHLEPLIEEYLGAELESHQASLKKQREFFTATLPSED